MDNKYQEALDNLIEIERERTFRRMGTFSHTNCDILQELVDKETPKKAYFLNYGGYRIDNYKCPSCNNIIRKFEDIENAYCIHCGQKLDWSEENEQ